MLEHILLVGRKSLFTEGLEKLLAKKSNQHITRIDPANTHALVTEIWRIHPSVVVLNTLSLGQPLAMLIHLRNYPALTLIVVNEYDNEIMIYEHEGPTKLLSKNGHLFDQDTHSPIPS